MNANTQTKTGQGDVDDPQPLETHLETQNAELTVKQPLPEVVKSKEKFCLDYRNANFFSKIWFIYANPMIGAVNKNQGKMKDEFLLDMTLSEDETQKSTDYFKKQLEYHFQNWVKRNPKKNSKEAPWATIVRKSIWGTFYDDYLFAAFAAFMSESITVSYTYFL